MSDIEKQFEVERITASEYERLKKDVSLFFREEFKRIKNKYPEYSDPKFRDFWEPYYFNDIKFFETKINDVIRDGIKVQLKDPIKREIGQGDQKRCVIIEHEYVKINDELKKDLAHFIKEYKRFHQNLVSLRSKRETRKERLCSIKTSNEPLSNLLMPYKAEYVERAGILAVDTYKRIMKDVSRIGEAQIEKITPLSKREYYRSVITQGEPRYVQERKNEAEEEFASWIDKMKMKIEKEIVETNMEGDPWKGSILTVKTSDGEIQQWSTKMIINRSKYNKLFYQFPTRMLTKIQ